jgi:predicted glycosyltransferase
VRAWIDVSNSPQVPFFRPLIALLLERGHDVRVTTREYAQTTELLALHGIEHDVVGPRHGGAGALGKARAMAGRLRALRRYARGREFEIALSHASHELPMIARSLGIPSAYAFDYEFARVQHGFGCRAAHRVVVPDAIPQERLDRLGARVTKVRRYPGLKEEYYLYGFVPDTYRSAKKSPSSLLHSGLATCTQSLWPTRRSACLSRLYSLCMCFNDLALRAPRPSKDFKMNFLRLFESRTR